MTGADISAALIVPFAAGFVVQRTLEIADRCWPSAATLNQTKFTERWKPFIMASLSLIVGLFLSAYGHIHLFASLGQIGVNRPLDILASGIFISAGTEGFNSLLKFASYQKEASKAKADVVQARGAEATLSAELASIQLDRAKRSTP